MHIKTEVIRTRYSTFTNIVMLCILNVPDNTYNSIIFFTSLFVFAELYNNSEYYPPGKGGVCRYLLSVYELSILHVTKGQRYHVILSRFGINSYLKISSQYTEVSFQKI